MNPWPHVRLGQLALDGNWSFVDGPFGSELKTSDYVDAGVPLLRIQNVRPNRYEIGQVRYITARKAEQLRRHCYRPGDLVITKLGDPCGVACVVPEHAGEGIIVADIVRFRGDPSRVDHRFIGHYLNSPLAKRQISQLAKGTTRQRVNLSNFREMTVPLPPLSEQRRIAEVLDRAEMLRLARRRTLITLQNLQRSIFVETFGDPVENPRKWPQRTGASLCRRITVGVVVKPASHYRERGVPALRSLNIRPGEIQTEDVVYFSREDNETKLAKSRLREGDVVVVRTGQPGTAAVVPGELDGANAIDIIIATPDRSQVLGEYLCAFLNSEGGKRIVLGAQRGQVQQHFNVGALNSALIPTPTLPVQREFIARLTSLERLGCQVRLSLAQIDALVASLQQRAFAGQL